MIKVLSPYYITTPLVSTASGLTCDDYTLYVYIWDGVKVTVPATANYEITIDNPQGSTGSDKVNISRLVADFIDFTAQTGVATSKLDGDNQVWVKTEVTYTTTDPNDATTPQEAATVLASKGYTYGNEGENATIANTTAMLQGDNFKVSRDSIAVVPVHIDEALAKSATVVSNPDSEINSTLNFAATTTSGELVQYIWVDFSETTSDTSVTVTFEGTSYSFLIKDEPKYDPIDVMFLNKDGGQQVLTFFKEQRSSVQITDSSFESDRGQPSLGNHQFVRYNVQARESLTANTGFVYEDTNEAFKQLFLSTRVWIVEGTTLTPINIKSKSLEYKTRLNEKLINYSIDFDYSYNEINSI